MERDEGEALGSSVLFQVCRLPSTLYSLSSLLSSPAPVELKGASMQRR